jgi:hypothetical protein
MQEFVITGTNVRGPLPEPATLYAVNLTKLDLSLNALTGTLPTAYKYLSQLTYADFGNNSALAVRLAHPQARIIDRTHLPRLVCS